MFPEPPDSKRLPPPLRYALALAIVALALLVRWSLHAWLGQHRPYVTLYGGVALAAWMLRWRPAALVAFAGFFAARALIPGPGTEFEFDAVHIADFAAYAFSTGLIIWFGEAMHRSRERAETAHRLASTNRELLSVTLSSIGDGVIATGADGCVSFLNAEAERLTGWSTIEAKGRPLPEVFHIVNEQTRQPLENPVEKVIRTGRVVGLANHTVLIAKDGRETPIDDSAAPIRGAGGPLRGVVLVFRDVSEQRAADFARNQLAAIVEQSGDAIFTTNLDGTIETWNAGAERFFGYRAGEIVGRPLTVLFPPERVTEDGKILAQVREGKASAMLETVRVAKDGRNIPVLLSVSPIRDGEGRVVGASKVVHDISELVEAREKAAREKELLATTLASIGDGVVVTDAQGRVTFLNPEAERLTGWTNTDAAGQPVTTVFRIVNEQTRQTVESPVEKVLRLGTVVGLANHTILIARDGTETPIDDSGAPIRQRGGGPIFGVVLVFRDFTAQKCVEQALREAHERAERASRAKDQFLATLSHELRTPLTPALLCATELEHDPAIGAEMREQLAVIRRNIQLEARLIDDLLDLTRISHGKLLVHPEQCDLHEIARHALDTVREDAQRKQLDLRVELEALRPHVQGDPARLQQVLWNLLKNAVKFTPAGGRVCVRSFHPEPGRLAVSVTDTGIGIAPAALDRIFQAFDQGDTAGRHEFGGLGLGLSISKAIVDLHGGALSAASEGRGHGAAFTVDLPCLAAPPNPGPVEHAALSTPVPLRLLVVEDHQPTLDTMRRLLEHDGHRVIPARTVREALAQSEAHECDLVISDLGLPDGTGFDFIAELRRRRDWPAIALSGYGMDEDLRRSAEVGFATHLVKPVDIDQLRRAIARASRRA